MGEENKTKRFDYNFLKTYYLIHLHIPHMFLVIFGYNFNMSINKKIVVATHNIDKQKEINSLLLDFNVTVLGMESFPEIDNIEETGSSLIENSFIKSKTVNELTGLACLADDTGLEVDALNGAPGVFSARYAGKIQLMMITLKNYYLNYKTLQKNYVLRVLGPLYLMWIIKTNFMMKALWRVL